MRDVVFVTGNPNKAKYFAKMLGFKVEHVAVELDEIQSLSLREVVEHKAHQAFEMLQRPVIVEDTSVRFSAMNGLPGPFIKWFLDAMSLDKICHLLDGFNDRSVVAGAAIAYYDGKVLEVFERELEGSVPNRPKGDAGFGWNPIFIPNGSDLTLGEMSDDEFQKWYALIKPFNAVAEFLKDRS